MKNIIFSYFNVVGLFHAQNIIFSDINSSNLNRTFGIWPQDRNILCTDMEGMKHTNQKS